MSAGAGRTPTDPPSQKPEAALQIVTKLQHAFEPPLDIDGEPLAVRASIGLSLFPRDAQDARTLMASADAAMYRIKQGHKRRL